jgi:hypothetical protein
VAVAGSLLRAVVTLALGLVVGVSAVGVHQWWVMLVVGSAAALAVVLALPRAWWSRPPFVAGFTAAVALGSLPRSEGDYLVGADGPGYALLGVTLVLVLLAVVTLPRPRWRHEPREPEDRGA